MPMAPSPSRGYFRPFRQVGLATSEWVCRCAPDPVRSQSLDLVRSKFADVSRLVEVGPRTSSGVGLQTSSELSPRTPFGVGLWTPSRVDLQTPFEVGSWTSFEVGPQTPSGVGPSEASCFHVVTVGSR